MKGSASVNEPRILLIENDRATTASIKGVLTQSIGLPVDVLCADTLAAASPAVDPQGVSVIVVALALSDDFALAALDMLTVRAPGVPVVVVLDEEQDASMTAAIRRAGHDCFVRAGLDAEALACGVRYAIERHRLHRALEESERRYRGLVEISREAILIHSGGSLVFVTDAAARMFGAVLPEQLLGKPFLDLVHRRERGAVAEHMRNAAFEESATFLMCKLLQLDGKSVKAEIAANACRYEGVAAVQLVLRDVTEYRRLESRLSYLERYDALTELPNRSELRERLEGALARATRNKQLVALMFLDADHFLTVNATWGQEAGDHVLKQIAERLKQDLRKGDTVARLGGDAFAMILEGLAEQEGANIVAQRQRELLSRPYPFDGHEIRLTVSMGIAFFPLDTQSIDALLRNADMAMHYVKEHGRNNFQLYSPELDTESRRERLNQNEIERRLASLTPREREVLDMLVAGKLSKVIAHLLGISARTIDIHRARVMTKMQADSVADLVRMMLGSRG
jgi:diguanylate cyclase (GGDEF)-like protein/PAS domain S-box-containing protein